jgi:polysaccharide pyruvyl transferase WcaK-like protein
MSTAKAPRVGFFGLLGHGNLGNDGALEAVLEYLRTDHPDAEIDFLCAGPERVTERYGHPAIRLNWNKNEYQTASGLGSIAIKVFAKVVDAVRTARWVRRQDVVIVPGMGVLEATLPLRPWGFPYSLFLLTASGRLVGTKVAMVSVGADTEGDRWVRRVFTAAARLAAYRSYRDQLSWDAVRASGLDVSGDEVYADLVFGLPTPAGDPPGDGTVGIGVMAYQGTNDERGQAGEVYDAYVAKLIRFARWLVDGGHRIRLFIGDLEDQQVADAVITDLRAYRPDLGPDWVVSDPTTSLTELMRQLTLVDTVVATRYHNVLCALKMGKPTVSIGYSAKNDVLMEEMGAGEFCQSIRTLDDDLLMEQFSKLDSRREQVAEEMARQSAANARRLREQFTVLSERLFGRPGGEGER